MPRTIVTAISTGPPVRLVIAGTLSEATPGPAPSPGGSAWSVCSD